MLYYLIWTKYHCLILRAYIYFYYLLIYENLVLIHLSFEFWLVIIILLNTVNTLNLCLIIWILQVDVL